MNRMKYLIFLLSLAYGKMIFAQRSDTTLVQIDSFLTAAFPCRINTNNDGRSITFECVSDTINYKIVKDRLIVIDKTKTGFDSSMESYTRVIVNSAPSEFKHRYTDTIIGGTKGAFVELFDPGEESQLQRVYIFYTVKDSFNYSVYLAIKAGTLFPEKTMNWFYSGLRFSDNHYESLPERAFTKKQFWYKMLAYILVVAALAYVIGSFFKKKPVPK